MRCFVAIDVPDEIKRKIGEIQKDLNRSGIKLVEPENLHFTLKFLGEISESKAEEIKQRLKEIEFQKFSIELAGVSGFPNLKYLRVIWIGTTSEKISELAKLIDKRLSSIGFKEEKKYVPHLTIARVKRKPSIEVIKFIEKYKSEKFGNFLVQEFSLKKSILTKSGPIYTNLLRVKLRS